MGGGSDLRLWTVNGDLIGHMHSPEAVCSLAFSNQPEGVSVNVIAGGLENGVVRSVTCLANLSAQLLQQWIIFGHAPL